MKIQYNTLYMKIGNNTLYTKIRYIWNNHAYNKYRPGIKLNIFSLKINTGPNIRKKYRLYEINIGPHDRRSTDTLCMKQKPALRKLVFHFLSIWMGYNRSDSFSFDFEPNGVPFGSKSKGKLLLRSYPIQFERKCKSSFLSVGLVLKCSILG